MKKVGNLEDRSRGIPLEMPSENCKTCDLRGSAECQINQILTAVLRDRKRSIERRNSRESMMQKAGAR